ncbi:MAG: hypothetical protein NW201_04310 [Gemmatimonadales bacterium]|nr:hypothetical protein [Gemmatimonadales bacterium]
MAAGAALVPGLRTVLRPKWRSARARLRAEGKGAGSKAVLLLLVGGLFFSATFAIAFRVLRYARGVPELGAFLPGKMLGVILLSFFSILLLSNLITALSVFFLAKDLDLLTSSPVDWLSVYLAKLGETLGHSSWMVALMGVPIFTAYGLVYDGGPLFPLIVLAAMVPLLVLPAVLGSVATLCLVNVFPARRARDILSLVALGAAGVAVVLLRVIRPERLARPEGFRNLLDFLVALKTPTSPWLPTEWSAQLVMNWLTGVADPLPPALLWSTAAAAVVLGAMAHDRLYHAGFSKAQEGNEKFVKGREFGRWLLPLLAGRAPATREFVLKDLRLFFRDATQWSQLLLLAVLLVVYLFNIRALPLFSGERVSLFLVTTITFLNLALAGFVLAAIAARFVFPAVSLEGKQMWLLRSSPLRLESLLWSKYWTGTVPLLVVAVLIVAMTNVLLRASAFMMALSLGTILVFTLTASALALAFGALWPQFDTENAAQIPTGFGGFAFMMACVSLLAVLVALEARPVLAYVRASQAGEAYRPGADLWLPVAAGALLCAGSATLALRAGYRRLASMEF